MNTNNENKLRPGDRVRLTGWSNDADKLKYDELFHHEARKGFPCVAIVTDNPSVVLALNRFRWDAKRFTYEKISNDGSNE